MRIQYKLVPIYVFPEEKWNCYFQNRIIIFCVPVPTLIYLWEILYFQDQSAYSAAGKYICGTILRIYKSLTYTWMWKLPNWDWGRAISRKGIHKWDIPCSVPRLYSTGLYWPHAGVTYGEGQIRPLGTSRHFAGKSNKQRRNSISPWRPNQTSGSAIHNQIKASGDLKTAFYSLISWKVFCLLFW